MKPVLGVSMGATLIMASIPVLAGEPILTDRELDSVTAGTSYSYEVVIREDGQVIQNVAGTYDGTQPSSASNRSDVVLKNNGVSVEIHFIK